MISGGKFSALGWSLLVHAVIAAGFLVTLRFTLPAQQSVQTAVEVIQAETISAEALEAREAAKEAQRQAELRRQREAAERAAAEQRRREEAARQAELRRQEEARRQAEAQARRRAEAEEAKRKAAAEEARRKAEAERQRKAEEEARRQAEAERKRREAEAAAREEREQQMLQSLEAEEQRMAAIRSGKQAEWVGVIRDKVMRQWSQPPNLAEDFYCEFEVRQIPGGEVVSVKVGKCDNEVLSRSAEAAIWKASPLPPPSDPSLFDQYVNVIFQPED